MFIEIQNSNFSEIIYISISLLAIFGHNLWLVGKNESASIRVSANTGDDFPESDSAVKPERVADFRLIAPDYSVPMTNYRVEENSLIADVPAANNRFFYAALALRAHPITLEATKFGGYIKEENAEAAVKPNFVFGRTTAPQRESYTKFAKVLLENECAPAVDISKLVAGHRLEIIPQTAPSNIGGSRKLPVQILFDGKPLAGLRVSSGSAEANGGRYSAHALTDANGLTEVQIQNAGHCFVRTHFIRPHFDQENFEWESFWASVTFRVSHFE